MTTNQVTYKVQFDESGSAFGTAFAATDVTTKFIAGLGFEPANITWGRQDQYADITPTTVTCAFRNETGAFTPGNAAAPAALRRGLRRRMIATVSATDVNLSEDYATSIEAIPDTSGLWTTQIDGQDVLGRLGGVTSNSNPNDIIVGTMLRSLLAEEIILDSPTALYMLQEVEGSTSFAEVTGTHNAATIGVSKSGAGVSVAAGQTPSGSFVAGTAVQIVNQPFTTFSTHAPGYFLSCPVATYDVEFWVQMPTAAPSAEITLHSQYAPDSSGLLFNLEPSGQFNLLLFGTGALAASGPAPLDGNMHHISIHAAPATATVNYYLDGVLGGTATGTAFATGTPTVASFSGAVSTYVGPQSFTQSFSGSFAYIAFYSSTLSPTRIAAHYAAGANALKGERTDQRITRLLSYRANTGSTVETGVGTIGYQDTAGRSLAECLVEVGNVEGGVVFVDGTGRVNFRNRNHVLNPTAAIVLDCSSGSVDFGSNFREDTQNVVNDATLTASGGGAAQRYANATSIAADGEYATALDLPFDSDATALSVAGWIVSNGTPSQIVATPVVVDLLRCPAATALAVLQLKPLDVVQLTNIDTHGTRAPSTTMSFQVQGGQLTLAIDAATAQLNVTPLPVTVVQINGDAAHGIGSTAIIGY